MKTSTTAIRMPGTDSGRMIWQDHLEGLAPRLRAASSISVLDGCKHRGDDEELERQVLPHLDDQHVPAELVVQHPQRLVDQPEAEQQAVDHAVKGQGVEDQEGRHQRRHEQRDLHDRSDEARAKPPSPQEQRQRIGKQERAEGAADADLDREQERVEELPVEERQPRTPR